MRRIYRQPLLILVALCGLATACAPKKDLAQPGTPAVAPGPAVDEALQERLGQLAERLEAARVEGHVPGMAIAVVKDDVVIYAAGFGHAELDGKRPATPQTVFAIGSSTKAFTSTVVATLVDEGKMGWDDLIEQHIPEMKLPVRRTDRKPTLRDAMSHRTGFTRMGVLWAGGGVSRTEMFATASGAEPLADYGKAFLYNNVVYASAGEAAARVAGVSWAELVTERLLRPLSMHASNTSAKVAGGDPKRAQGYRYDDAADAFVPVPMRDLDLIGPAGSINSNVIDMAQWVRLQLGRGEIDGTRVVSKERIEDTWSPQIKVGGSMQYGLGWFISDWNGHRVVEHGGNIDGYAAAVALMPDDDLGFVLLTNVSATPLQRSVRGIVWETLVGSADPAETDEPALDASPYLGKYVADFGPFDDQRFTVTSKGGKLFVDVPGQTNYELLAADGDGKWKFAVAAEIAASFELGDKGKANVLRLHQGGLDMEMPREGWTPPAEIDLTEHEGHLGSYAPKGDKKAGVTVVVRGNRLAVDVPGQMVYELHKPDADGKWRFRVKKDELSVTFERGTKGKAKGRVVGLVLHQGGTDTAMVRKRGVVKVPTVAELAALRNAAPRQSALDKLGLVEATGTIRLAQSGVEGKVRIVFDAKRSRTEIDLGPFGTIVEVHNGERAWSEGSLGPVQELHGKYLEQARQGHPAAFMRPLEQSFDTVTVAPAVDVEGSSRLRVTLRTEGLPTLQALADPKTGDIVQTQGNRLAAGIGGIPTKATLSDFRNVLGLRFPFTLQSEDQPSGRTVVTLEKLEVSKADPAQLFPAAPPKG